jgi:hypothetical protein
MLKDPTQYIAMTKDGKPKNVSDLTFEELQQTLCDAIDHLEILVSMLENFKYIEMNIEDDWRK